MSKRNKSSGFKLFGSFLAGITLEESVIEARDLARKLGICYVEYLFNGIHIIIGEHACVKTVVWQYTRARQAKQGDPLRVVINNGYEPAPKKYQELECK